MISNIYTYKILDVYFKAVLDGTKTFEVRKDDRERKPKVNDLLRLIEVDEYYELTGKKIFVRVTYILNEESFPLFDNDGNAMFIMGIRKLRMDEIATIEILENSKVEYSTDPL